MQEAVRSAYQELEGGTRMAQLSLPEPEESRDAPQAGESPTQERAPSTERSAVTAPTIVSQRKVQERFVRNVVVALAVFAGASVAVMMRLLREPPAPEVTQASPRVASGAPPPMPAAASARPLVPVTRTHEVPVGSAKLVVPVIAVSALPPERTSDSATPPSAP